MSAAVFVEELQAVGLGDVLAASDAFRDVVERFDPDLVSGEDARRAAEALIAVDRACTRARIAAALRTVESSSFPRHGGSRDGADWWSRACGTSRLQALAELRLAGDLERFAATRVEFGSGRLSEPQAVEIVLTAREDPRSEAEMIALAQRADLQSLCAEGLRRRLDAIGPEQLRKRQRKARFHRWRKDRLGMLRGSYAVLPEDGLPAMRRLDADTDRRVATDKRAANEAAKRGEIHERQTRDQHAADALLAMLGSGDTPTVKTKPARAEIVLVGDVRSLLAGTDQVGDGCWIQGGGPMTVDRFRELLLAGDAFIKAVVHNGSDVVAVQHLGRKIPATLRTALSINPSRLWEAPVCSDGACGRTLGLELDHITPIAAGGTSSYENYDWKCWLHHRQKTEADRAAGLLTPPRPSTGHGDAGERGPP